MNEIKCTVQSCVAYAIEFPEGENDKVLTQLPGLNLKMICTSSPSTLPKGPALLPASRSGLTHELIMTVPSAEADATTLLDKGSNLTATTLSS